MSKCALYKGIFTIMLLLGTGLPVLAFEVAAELKASGVEAPNIVRQVETLAALKSLSGSAESGQYVYLDGRITKDDGGEGYFRWDVSDLSSKVMADSQSGIYVAPNFDQTGTRGAWVRTVDDHINPQWFGAIGDWNGERGTDNLAALNYAVSALPVSGGVIAFPTRSDGRNDYLISDSWNIRKDNVTVYMPTGVTLRTVTATTYGHALAFVEGAVYGGSDAARTENVRIWGGGTVSSANVADNAIGFTRVTNFRCEGMTAKSARMGITAQGYCTNGWIIGNEIDGSGNNGIDTTDNIINVYIVDNNIKNAGNHGIHAWGVAGLNILGNEVDTTNAKGVYIYKATGVSKNLSGQGNVIKNTNQEGVYINQINGVNFSSTVHNAGTTGIDIRNSAEVHGVFNIDSAGGVSCILNSNIGKFNLSLSISNSAASVVAISATNMPPGNQLAVNLSGSHTYALATIGAAVNLLPSMLTTGTKGLYTGTTPTGLSEIYVDGARWPF